MRVAVGQIDDQADHDLIVFQVIEERAASVLVVQRPARGVHDQALLMLGGVDVPQLLDADGVVLRVDIGVELEAVDQLLADMSAAAFGEQRVLGAQLHAWGVHAFFRVAFAIDAQVTGDDAAHDAVFVDQRFLGGETRVDLDTQVLGLLGQPAAQVAQGDDVIAFVVHGLGDQRIGQLAGRFGGLQQIDVVTLDRRVERGAEFFPVGEQFVQRTRFEDRAGQDMGTYFGAFLDDAYTDFLTSVGGFLLQAAGCG